MTIKDRDRRKAFWISFIYIVSAPLMVMLGGDIETIKHSVLALTGLGVANYFSKPSGD